MSEPHLAADARPAPTVDGGGPMADRGQLQADAIGGSVWTAVQTVVGLPVTVVANAIVANSLGAAGYGTLATYLAVYGILAMLLSAGINDASVQWIATHRARGETAELLAAVRRCSGYHVVVEAPLVMLAVGAVLYPAGVRAMALGAGSAFGVMVMGTSTIVMSGSAMNALAARISIVVTLATQTTLILTALSSPMPGSVFAAKLLASLAGPALALALIPPRLRRAVLRPILPRGWPNGFLPYAFRTCAAGLVATLVFSRSEIFLFQAYGRTAEAGVFALSSGVAGLITAPIDSILGPLLPATTALLATTPERAGRALMRGLRTSTLLAGLALAGGLAVLTPVLTLIYGASFSAATIPFVALAVVSCIQSVNHPIVAFQLAARRTDVLLKVSLLALAVDLAVAAATIPTLGVTGAVIANAAGQLISLTLSAVQVGRMLGVPVREHLRAMGYFVDAFAVTALALGVEWALRDQHPLIRSAAGLVVVLLLLAVAGRLRPRTGLEPADLAVISNGLPRLLRRPFRWFVAAFAVEARPDQADQAAHAEASARE